MTVCAICLDCIIPITSNYTTICNHNFHLNCIITALYYKSSCPMCRTPILISPLNTITKQRCYNAQSGQKWTVYKDTKGDVISSIPLWL
jgi:hypothetical protein